jgi:hypothetical protein
MREPLVQAYEVSSVFMSVVDRQRLLSMRMRTFELERHLESTILMSALAFSSLSTTHVCQLPDAHADDGS